MGAPAERDEELPFEGTEAWYTAEIEAATRAPARSGRRGWAVGAALAIAALAVAFVAI